MPERFSGKVDRDYEVHDGVRHRTGHRRWRLRIDILSILLVVYLIALLVAGPQQTGTLRHVIGWAAISIVFCVVVVYLARHVPGIDSWADLGLRRAAPFQHRWSTVAVTVTASIAYIAAQWLSRAAGSTIAATVGSPELSTSTPAEFPPDIVRSIQTSISEEILLFAVPLALGGLAWRKARSYRYLSAGVQRTLIIIVTVLYVVGIRVGGHWYWGFPAVVFTVVPWMVGAWMIFCIAGTIWPLIIGHIVFDVYVFAMTRAPDVQWVSTLFGLTVIVGTCVIFAAPLLVRWVPLSMQMWRIEQPAKHLSVSAVSSQRGDAPGAVEPGGTSES